MVKARYYIPLSILAVLILSIIHVGFANASLGTFQQNNCANIRILSNCSSVNLVEISNGKIDYYINSSMTHLAGQTFNYSFCNTSEMSVYSFSWYDSCTDCSQGSCGNNFDVTADGHPYSNFPIEFLMIALALIFLILNRYVPRVFETRDLFNLFAGMLFLIAGILTLYPGFNYFNYTNLQGLGLGIVLIGIGGMLTTKQLGYTQ